MPGTLDLGTNTSEAKLETSTKDRKTRVLRVGGQWLQVIWSLDEEEALKSPWMLM